MLWLWRGYHPNNFDSQRKWEFESPAYTADSTKNEITSLFYNPRYLWISKGYFSG